MACDIFLSIRTQTFFAVIAQSGMIQCNAQTPKTTKVAPGDKPNSSNPYAPKPPASSDTPKP